MSASEKDNISKMSDYNGRFMTMKDALEKAIQFTEDYNSPNLRGIVILLNDEDDEYDVNLIKCDIRPSEVVSLLEYVKYYFLDEISQ